MRAKIRAKLQLSSFIAVEVLTVAWWSGLGGCSAPRVTSPLPPLPEVPQYVAVPHPAGLTISDLRAIFMDENAHSLESLRGCEGDFQNLQSKTESKEELRQGARELVRIDPEKYHWCFYGKILQLEEELTGDLSIEERQKKALDIYFFLTPIAKAFIHEYQDSRYLRWAIVRYRQLSEVLFFRTVEPGPEVMAELVASSSTPMTWVSQGRREPAGVLEKYGIQPTQLGVGARSLPNRVETAPLPGNFSKTPYDTEVESEVPAPGVTPLAVE